MKNLQPKPTIWRKNKLAHGIMLALLAGSALPATTLATTFHGVKFNDLNGNGIKDPGEDGLANKGVFVKKGSVFGNSQVYTDINGHYEISIPATSPDIYTLWTTIPNGMQQTTPEKGTGSVYHMLQNVGPNANLEINFGMWDGVERNNQDQLLVDAGPNQVVEVGDRVNVNGSLTAPKSSKKHEIFVDFGDKNTVIKIIDSDSNTRKRTRAGEVTSPFTVNHTFQQPGKFETKVTATNEAGETVSDTAELHVNDLEKTDPCDAANAVQTTRSGQWDDKTIWSPVGMPDPNDWVIIKPGHTVTMPDSMKSSFDKTAEVKGLCVDKNATVQSAPNSLDSPDNPTWAVLRAATLHNLGTIRGEDGVDGKGPWCQKGQYQRATKGSSLAFWTTRFVNDGQILAGNGGTDPIWMYMNDGCARGFDSQGGDAGNIEIYTGLFLNNSNGLIQTGDGGSSERRGPGSIVHSGKSEGGNGGSILVQDAENPNSANNGTISVGDGGDAHSNGGTTTAGTGGTATLNYANHNGMIKGAEGSVIRVDPTTLRFGPNTKISGADEVHIYGGEDWVMEVNDLKENAITARDKITFAVGKGGIIDFRGSAPNAIKAGACTAPQSLDVIYILDTSLSMDKTLADGQKRIEAAKQAITELNQTIAQNPENRVALVTFDQKATIQADLSTDIDSINQTIAKLKLRLYTRLHKGVDMATDLLTTRQAQQNRPVVILFSDGGTPEEAARNSLDNLMANVPNALVHSVGIGGSAASSVLQYAVKVGNGEYYSTNDTVALTDALAQALEQSKCPTTTGTSEVEIFADQVLLDPGMTLETLINADKVTQKPAKIIYQAVWSEIGYLEGEPGETLLVPLTLLNAGPLKDDYTLQVTDSAGWDLGKIPQTIPVNGLRRTTVELAVTLPNTHGAQNEITVTATSKADPSMVATLEVKVGVEAAVNTGGGDEGDENEKPQLGNAKAFGTVRDKFGDPIIGALVRVGDYTAITDSKGYWEIDQLNEGEYEVIVSKPGFAFKTDSCQAGQDQPCQPRIKPTSELAVTVEPSDRNVGQGTTLSYLITVTNQGDKTATDVVITDTLPEGSQLIAFEPLNGGQCDLSTQTCDLPILAPGGSTQVKLEISNETEERLLNTVEVVANEYPADITKTWVAVTPYLSLDIADDTDPVAMQSPLQYQMQVTLSDSAPDNASGIELTFELPKGVELQGEPQVESGTCDTSNLPVITCTLDDLTAGDTTQITMDVLLTDPGLLLLTQEATIKANEYPAYTARERTKILIDERVKVDMIFVIDDSNSMADEINSIIKAIKAFIQENLEPGTSPFLALVTFKDTVKVKAATTDLNMFLAAVEDVKVSGGGACPEASSEALEVAITHLRDGGVILLATDASPYQDADLEKLSEMIKNKAMKFVPIITGDCTMPGSWNELTTTK
jgi:uncharacterized repeat protein (TIGR01451 family)